MVYTKYNNYRGSRCWCGCRCLPTLTLSSTLKMWLGDSNEMCLQGLSLSSTQKLAFHYDLALLHWQPAMNAVGVCSSIKWKHKLSGRIVGHKWSVSNIRMVLEKRMNWLPSTLCSLSFVSVIWELHPSPSTLLIQASNFINLSVLLKCFYAQCVQSVWLSWCACSAQPVMTV